MWFWDENYKYNPDNKCLEWKGRTKVFAYPRVSYNGQSYVAHRMAYLLHNGEDPGELLVRHLCSNRLCGRKEHLALGTHWENSRDMVEAGRSQKGDRHWIRRNPERFKELQEAGAYQPQRQALIDRNGENHPKTKLTAYLVRQIKIKASEGVDNKTLAKEFGVTHSNISAIILGKSWKHVDIPTREPNHNPGKLLSETQVKEIRLRHRNGEGRTTLGKEFGVKPHAIYKIVNYLTWKHVKDDES
jgi:hypothetical protein